MFQTKIVEKIKTICVFDNFFPPENRTIYEIMWNSTVQQDRPQMIM